MIAVGTLPHTDPKGAATLPTFPGLRSLSTEAESSPGSPARPGGTFPESAKPGALHRLAEAPLGSVGGPGRKPFPSWAN